MPQVAHHHCPPPRPRAGEFREPLLSIWPVARVGLRMMFRYWPFWVIYALGMMIFLFFFFAQYFLAWADTQVTESSVQVGGFVPIDPRDLFQFLRHTLKMT